MLELSVRPGGARRGDIFAYSDLHDVRGVLEREFLDEGHEQRCGALALALYGESVTLSVIERGAVKRCIDLRPFISVTVAGDPPCLLSGLGELEDAHRQRWDDLVWSDDENLKIEFTLDWSSIKARAGSLQGPRLREGERCELRRAGGRVRSLSRYLWSHYLGSEETFAYGYNDPENGYSVPPGSSEPPTLEPPPAPKRRGAPDDAGAADRALQTMHGRLEKKRHSELLELADAALQRWPTRLPFHLMRGLALTFLDRHEEAIDAYSAAVKVRARKENASYQPGLATCFYNRACEHAHLGHRTRALDDLERAIGRDDALARSATTERYFDALRGEARFVKLVRGGLTTVANERLAWLTAHRARVAQALTLLRFDLHEAQQSATSSVFLQAIDELERADENGEQRQIVNRAISRFLALALPSRAKDDLAGLLRGLARVGAGAEDLARRLERHG